MLSLALAWLPFYYSSLSEASTCFAEKRKTWRKKRKVSR
jgi:hypothetical protein